jgi:hypothetical protein
LHGSGASDAAVRLHGSGASDAAVRAARNRALVREAVTLLEQLRVYFNTCMAGLSKRFQCSVPYIDTAWQNCEHALPGAACLQNLDASA